MQTKEEKKEYLRIWYLKNRERRRESCNENNRKWRLENKERLKLERTNNKEKKKEYDKQYNLKNQSRRRESNKQYRILNRDKKNLIARTYLANNLNAKLAHSLRRRLRTALKKRRKCGSAVRDLGCSIEYFKHYIAGKFIPGMTWENYGSVWHLDHIIPLSSFDLADRTQFLKAVHYTNLQPLWATTAIAREYGDMISIGNLEKGNRTTTI
jgi:hypothetical protein